MLVVGGRWMLEVERVLGSGGGRLKKTDGVAPG
jgi:hypothetical protein